MLLRRVDALDEEVQKLRAALSWRASQETCDESARCALLDQLPPSFTEDLLALLPVDARARAAVVCRRWRAVVADPRTWRVLDLSPETVSLRHVTDDVLRAAAARCAGQLTVLNVNGCDDLSDVAILEVVEANALSLRELHHVSKADTVQLRDMDADDYDDVRIIRPLSVNDVDQFLGAAPHLLVFSVYVRATLEEAARMLRNEAPYGTLRVSRLVAYNSDWPWNLVDAALALAFAADVAQHAALQRLHLHALQLPLDTLDALADAALLRRLRGVSFDTCRLAPAAVHALVRILDGGFVESLHIFNDDRQLLDPQASEVLAAAIRTSTALQSIRLEGVEFWGENSDAVAVIHAMTGHPTLREVSLSGNKIYICGGYYGGYGPVKLIGAALGALVAANLPALQVLDLSYCELGEYGMQPLLEALRNSTNLRTLRCDGLGKVSGEFLHNIFMPAVRENTSLRELKASAGQLDTEGEYLIYRLPCLVELEALVKARNVD